MTVVAVREGYVERELTQRQWGSLERAVGLRARRYEPPPSTDAVELLGRNLAMRADGISWPSQGALAASLCWTEERVSGRLRELASLGFVRMQRRGNQPADVRPIVETVRLWASGDYQPCAPEIGGANAVCDPEIGGANGPCDPEIGGALARGTTSSSSSSSSSEAFSAPSPSAPSMPPASAAAAYHEHQAMLAILKRWGIRLPAGGQDYIRSWVGRYPVERVADAACKAWTHADGGTPRFAYVQAVLSNTDLATELPDDLPRPEGVVAMHDFAGLRPWTGRG